VIVACQPTLYHGYRALHACVSCEIFLSQILFLQWQETIRCVPMFCLLPWCVRKCDFDKTLLTSVTMCHITSLLVQLLERRVSQAICTIRPGCQLYCRYYTAFPTSFVGQTKGTTHNQINDPPMGLSYHSLLCSIQLSS
jgi:hypothetical protein